VQQPTPVVFSGAREWCPKCQTQFTVVDPSQEWVHCPNPACAQLIHRQVTGGKQKVESKAIVPAILSFLVPGVGQFMNGDTGKGFIFLVVWLICVVLSIVSCGILGLLDLIVGIWAAYDAYQGPAK
jgi:TM2 domain-containing membrane protein YozV